ncbi:MAG: hypothetical protein V1899_00135 [Planctomycetota bacterium]
MNLQYTGYVRHAKYVRHARYAGYVRHAGLGRLVTATLIFGVLCCLTSAAQAAERYWVGAGTGGGGGGKKRERNRKGVRRIRGRWA